MRIAMLVTLPLAALVLAGCTSNPVSATPHAATPAAASSAPVSTPTTPPPTQDAADATPVTIGCKKLLPTVVAHELQSDLKLQKGWVPTAGTTAANVVNLHGTACMWSDSLGNTVIVAVAKLSSHDATALKNDLVLRSNSVPTYGGEAYFQVVQHQGVADAFRGRTWLLAQSNLFYEPGDAADVVAASFAGLGLGPKVVTPSEASKPASATPTPTTTPSG